MRTDLTRTARSVVAGFFCLGVCVAVTLVMFWENPLSRYACAYCIGLTLLAVGLLDAGLTNLYQQVQENVSAAACKRLAYLDGLTSLRNRMAFIEAQQKVQEDLSLACAVLDVNNLKQINDRFGHQEGDRVILTAGNLARDVFRRAGECYCIGGDEFAVLMSGCDEARVRSLVEEIGRRVDEMPLSIAVGYAMRCEGESVEQTINRADRRMYEAKQSMKARA